jgi:hypothetical protein
MNVKLFRSFVAATVIGIAPLAFAPAAFAAGLDGIKYQKEMTLTLRSGKTVTVMVGEMDGKTLAVIPMQEFADVYERAEGHAMSNN